MALRLTNTLSRKKEVFKPNRPGRVGIYVCGPTVYSHAHLGHARSAVFYDVLVRYLEACGYRVCFVRNITDLDDKIIRAATRGRTDCCRLASNFIAAFHEDMHRLNVRQPTLEPRASAYITPMQEYIAALLQNGHAYCSGGDVYFSIDTLGSYGRLSGRYAAETTTGRRLPPNPAKRNPLDFALWKSKPGAEPVWESPWGRGRPGWHIECTTMAGELLSANFDIHGGGVDLIFPHHENEIAQSLGVHQTMPANWWVHHAMVNCGGRKMSKSCGTPVTIRAVTADFHPEAIRLYLLEKSYRRSMEYSYHGLCQAAARLDRFYAFFKGTEQVFETRPDGQWHRGLLWNRFCEALDDDVNIARGCAVLLKTIGDLRRRLTVLRKSKNSAEFRRLRRDCGTVVGILQSVLGILQDNPAHYAKRRESSRSCSRFISPEEIERLVAERTAARQAGLWQKADRIRKQLDIKAVQISDTAEGTRWKRA
jgi:cysteinyl-tRNA synthetase